MLQTCSSLYTVKKEAAILKKDDTSKSFSNNYFTNTKITSKQSKIQSKETNCLNILVTQLHFAIFQSVFLLAINFIKLF